MQLQERERKLLIAGGILVPLMIAYWMFGGEDNAPTLVKPIDVSNIPAAERRLTDSRRIAATVPAQQQLLQKAGAELAAREKGLILADTAAQAQAQLLQILRNVAKAQAPPINLRNSEIGPVKNYGDRYGEVIVSLNFDARMEQLVQFISDITARPELIGLTNVSISQAHPKEKTIPVRLTLSGLVRRELVPEKKSPGAL